MTDRGKGRRGANGWRMAGALASVVLSLWVAADSEPLAVAQQPSPDRLTRMREDRQRYREQQQQQVQEQRRQQELKRRQQEQQVRGQPTPPSSPPLQGAPAYLKEMPTVADVLQKTSGSDPVDTAARQAGAFNQLIGVMRVLRQGGEFGRIPTSPQENALGQTYLTAKQEAERRGQSLMAKTATATSGPESAAPKWFRAKDQYDNEAFRRELLSGSWPRLWDVYRARDEAERQVTEAAKQQQPGMANPSPTKPSQDHPRRRVMPLRLGMSLKQVLEALTTNKPAFEVAPYEPQEARDLPGTRYVPTLTARATTADGGSDSFELTFSPPPLPSQLIRIARWRYYSNKEEGMAVPFTRTLQEKYGPSQNLRIHGGVDSWAWNRAGVSVGPSAELAMYMGKRSGIDVQPGWFQRAWAAGLSQIVYLKRFSCKGNDVTVGVGGKQGGCEDDNVSWSFMIDVIDVESEMAALDRYSAAVNEKKKRDFDVAKDRKSDL
jgi:hypothetical protein